MIEEGFFIFYVHSHDFGQWTAILPAFASHHHPRLIKHTFYCRQKSHKVNGKYIWCVIRKFGLYPSMNLFNDAQSFLKNKFKGIGKYTISPQKNDVKKMIAWYDLPFSIVNDVIEYLASPEKCTESLWPLGLFSQYLTGCDVLVHGHYTRSFPALLWRVQWVSTCTGGDFSYTHGLHLNIPFKHSILKDKVVSTVT